MRRFTVYRRGDLSATHNADQVNAPDQPQYEGVVFSDGTTVLRWLTAARSTSVWASFDEMWRIHGHDDPNSKHHTEIVWHDGANAEVHVPEWTCVCGAFHKTRLHYCNVCALPAPEKEKPCARP